MIGRPFQSGRSGNPSGRPKDMLGALLREKKELPQEIFDAVHPLLKSAKESTRIWAAEFLRDSAWGKPSQVIGASEELKDLIINSVNFSNGAWVKSVTENGNGNHRPN